MSKNEKNEDFISNEDELDNINEDELDDINLDDDVDLGDDLNDEIEVEKEKETEFEIMFKSSVNKHKQEGTHSLQRDTIFMGKKEEDQESQEMESTSDFYENTYDIEKGSTYEYETHFNEDYNHKKTLSKDIYDILDNKTEIDFLMNRRKPNKKMFNIYYEMCVEDLSLKYSLVEIFDELSYYFTDNIFNMFKLLNKKNASGIIMELIEKGYLKDIGNINFI